MIDYPNKLQIIFDKLNKIKIKPIIVGGYVRDYLQGLYSKDIDIELYNVTSYEKLQKILSEFGNTNILGKNYGVIKLKIDNINIDFSLPRTDSKISNGHKGFKIDTSKTLDFKSASFRRDFTINTIGYDIFTKTLLDPYNGIDDLKNKILKYVDKNTFKEDPLRVLRAMQFCARFELKIDSNLINLCQEMIYENCLEELPHERIYEEFKKLFLKAKKPSTGLKFLKTINGLDFFNELVMDNNLWQSTLKSINSFHDINTTNTNMTILLALLCYKIDENKIDSFIAKLTNKKNIVKDIKSFHHVAKYFQNTNTILLYKILKDINIDEIKVFLGALEINVSNIELIYPTVHGRDLIKLGIQPSKDFNYILQKKYEEQIKKVIFR